MNLVIFGAGDFGKMCFAYFAEYRKDCQIIAIWDNNVQLHGKLRIKGREATITPPPSECTNDFFDKIIVSPLWEKNSEDIKKQLQTLGIPKDKIVILKENTKLLNEIKSAFSIYDEENDARIGFILSLSRYVKEENIPGNVAECGVFNGNCAVFINRFFSDRICYLFDSFEGFCSNDIERELKLGNESFRNSQFNHVGFFSGANERHVLEKMMYPELCVIRKGHVPETFKNFDDIFCFVNLDMDLYQPMLEALKFFYPRMVLGGVILLHDYFHPELPGVKLAVAEFETVFGKVVKIPIGDGCSLAIIKN